MKKCAGFLATGLAMLLGGNMPAATLPGAIGDDYLQPLNLDRVTIGANYENIRRIVEPDKGADFKLKAVSYSLYLGVDVTQWLTVFGTVGQSENNDDTTLAGLPAGDNDTGWESKWSVGLNANLWWWNMRVPRWTLGDRLTIRAFLEYADYQVDEPGGSSEWTDLVVALPIALELFEDNSRMPEDELFRLALYAGPMLSMIDGSRDSVLGKTDFQEADGFGFIVGLDIYLTRYLSLGGQAQFFDADADDTSLRASLRYHF